MLPNVNARDGAVGYKVFIQSNEGEFMKKLLLGMTLLCSLTSFASNNCYEAFIADSKEDNRPKAHTLKGVWTKGVFMDARTALDDGDPNLMSVTVAAAFEVYFTVVARPFFTVTAVPVEYISLKNRQSFDKTIADMIAGVETKKTRKLKKSFFNLTNYKTGIEMEDFNKVLAQTLQSPNICPYRVLPTLTNKGMEFIRNYGYESFTFFAIEHANDELMESLFADPANYRKKYQQATLDKDGIVKELISRSRNF